MDINQLKDNLKKLEDADNYTEILDLLDNKTLSHFNNAFLYGTRGWANLKLNKLQSAIYDFDKAIEIDPNFYPYHINRGVAYHKQRKFEKALTNYNKALELKKDDDVVQYNIALANFDLSKFDEAIKFANQLVTLNEKYHSAYRILGDAYLEKNELQNALDNYEKAISFKEAPFKYLESRIKLVKEKIEERKAFEKIKAVQRDKDLIVKIENEVQQTINKIRLASISDVKTVVHYTKILVSKIYVTKNHSKMHYSNAIYMNDPMEGKIFFDYLENSEIEEAYLNGERRTETSVYLGSFLPAEENDGEVSHEDELVMWRTYGKDENGNEAAGCNIVLNSDFFKSNELTESHNSNSVDHIGSSYGESLLNVVYVKRLKNKKEIVKDPKSKITKQLAKLKAKLQEMIQIRNKYDRKDEFHKEIENSLFRQLSGISYLFKSADYSFENEVRVIVYMPRNSDSVKFRKVSESDSPPKKFFIESNNDILPFIKKIYLGPKVKNYQQWSLYFDYEIRQRSKDYIKEEKCPYKIKPSEIEIIKSECKFQ